MSGLMHQLDISQSLHAIHRNGKSGGKIPIMWSYISLWARITSLFTRYSFFPPSATGRCVTWSLVCPVLSTVAGDAKFSQRKQNDYVGSHTGRTWKFFGTSMPISSTFYDALVEKAG